MTHTVQDLVAWAQQGLAQALAGMQHSTGAAFGQHCDDFVYYNEALQLVARFELHCMHARCAQTQPRSNEQP